MVKEFINRNKKSLKSKKEKNKNIRFKKNKSV